MPSIEFLAEEIATLREQLHKALAHRDHFHSLRVVQLSVALDEKILEFMLLDSHKE